MKQKIQSSEFDNISRLLDKGNSRSEIARIYGVSPSCITNFLNRGGRKSKREEIKETQEEMIRMRESGLTLSQIGEKTGYTRAYVAVVVKRRGEGLKRVFTSTSCVYNGLRKELNASGTSVEEFAEVLGLDSRRPECVGAAKRILNGKRELRKHEIDLILAKFKKSYEEIFLNC